MAIGVWQAIETESHASGFWSRRRPKPWAVLGVALALVYLPHLIAYSTNLMQREHYQFFPLAWLGSVTLVWIRRDDLNDRGDVAVPAAGWAGVGLASLMLAAAGILNSSWLAMVSVLPMALGMAWLVGNWSAIRVIGPALLLFATTIRLPGLLDAVLIRELRALAVGISSRVLDAIGIIHVPSGNILRVPGGDLLVDEACSGVNSLVSIVAVVLFLGLLLRRRPIPLAVLLAWSAGIVVLANVARVSIVTIAFARWQIDLLHGWKHEALGVALYAVSLGLVMSLDQFVLLLKSIIPRRSPRYPQDPTDRRVPGRSQSSSSDVDSSHLRAAGPRPRHLAICATALAAIALISPIRWAFGARVSETDMTEVAHLVKRAKGVLSEQSMPAELAGWRRISFKTEERKSDDAFGQYSACWQYRLGSRTALVSVDYPFWGGWHELTVCYGSIDWTLQQRLVQRGAIDAGTEPSAAYVAATMSHRNGEHASLRFGLVDDQGRWIEPPSGEGLGLTGREMAWGSILTRPCYQFQVLGTGFRPHGDEEQQQYTRLFLAASREFKRQLFDSGAIAP